MNKNKKTNILGNNHTPTSVPLVQIGAPLITRLGNWLSLKSLKSLMIQKGIHNKVKLLDVLDLGCGYDAQMLLHYNKVIKNGIGMDSQVNENLRKIPNLKFIEGDINIEINKLYGYHFDIITAINFFEHLSNPLPLICKAKKMLVPGGQLFLTVPTWMDKIFLEYCNFKLGLGGENAAKSLDEHKMYYSKKDVWLLLIKAGFLPSQINLAYIKCGLVIKAIAININ